MAWVALTLCAFLMWMVMTERPMPAGRVARIAVWSGLAILAVTSILAALMSIGIVGWLAFTIL